MAHLRVKVKRSTDVAESSKEEKKEKDSNNVV